MKATTLLLAIFCSGALSLPTATEEVPAATSGAEHNTLKYHVILDTPIELNLPMIPESGAGVKMLRERQQATATCQLTSYWSDGVIGGQCRDTNGNYRTTQLDMNFCMGNNDGWLTWTDNGRFILRCESPYIDGSGNYVARCLDLRQTWNWSNLHLDEKLGNQNGQLVCFGHVGS